MANDGSPTGGEESMFTRPRFLIAAIIVVIIALLGTLVAVRVARTSHSETPPSTSSATPSDVTSRTTADAIVCGLKNGDQGPLTTGPAAIWKYEGAIAYPESADLGPAKTAPAGYRYCFQHSPAGAVMMAANALAQGSDPVISDSWIKYALAAGPHRTTLLTQGGASGGEGTRLKITGFRVLYSDVDTARIDLVANGSSRGQSLTVSVVYELVWQDDDWKVSADVETPVDTAVISDAAGYTPWGG